MESVVLKSFLPEVFFSISILLQIIFNVRLVNTLKYNFPLIEKEVATQTVFILLCLLFFYGENKLEGFLSTFTLLNDAGTQISKIFLILVCLVLTFFIYEAHKMQKLNFFEFYSLYLLSIFGLLLMISSSDLIIFYLAMETQALCFYVLASFNRGSIFSVEAGLKYFIAGSFISGFYLLGASFIYGALGTLNLHDINLLLSFDLETYSSFISQIVLIGIILITTTLLFKIACAPFHFWAPDVYEGSPLSSTLIFAIVPKVSLFFFFVKWLNTISLFSEKISGALLVFGILSAFVGTFFAISQKRLKRLIIYSSIAQTGFMVCALSVQTLEGYTSLYFFLVIYLITSILIWGHFVVFYSFFAKTTKSYGKQSDPIFISSLTNFYKYNSLWCFSLVVVFFSVAGIPPLTGFLSKMLIIYELIISQAIISSIVLIVISSVSVYYYIRVLKNIYFESKTTNCTESFKIIHNSDSLDHIYFIFTILMLVLIILFYFPTLPLVMCQYMAISSYGF